MSAGCLFNHLGMSKNRGTPKSSILIGFSTIFTIHFGGCKIPLFLETNTHLYVKARIEKFSIRV